jgi:hypothetical protein
MTTDRCGECGFDYDADPEVYPSMTDVVVDMAALLRATAPDVLRVRQEPNRWSPLEYACHLRDVLLVQRERVLAARRTDGYTCEPMGREERVEHDGYAEQAPEAVARQLTDAALLFTTVLDRLAPGDWDRTVRYFYPEPEWRSLRWVARHTAHEVRHHLLDIRRQLAG